MSDLEVTSSDVYLSKEDLEVIKESQKKAALVYLQAEKGIQASQLAELEHKNLILTTYIKYKLDNTDTIDEKTGRIVKKDLEEKK